MCDVHALASEAAQLEAETEKFLDEALISSMRDAPLTTLDAVLSERQEAAERSVRVGNRAKELMEAEMAKARHEREVKELEEAISVTAPPPSSAAGKKRASPPLANSPTPAPPLSESTEEAAAAAALPFELESAQRQPPNPYILNLTEFVPEVEATRQARDLKKENEVLRACLQVGVRPNAFEGYLRRSTHTSL